MENIVLVDWLTFTSKIWSENDLINVLHLSDVSWEHFDSYRYGYSHRCTFSGISILSGGTDDMGICVEFSGTGCRSFETYSNISWIDLFNFLLDPYNEFNITHIDLAYDDHDGILDMDDLLYFTDNHFYRSKSRWWKVEYGSCGTTIYHGSPQSNFRCRIYDKAAERGLLDGTHWIRVEIVLRDVNALLAVKSILDFGSIGIVFSGVLRNYLCYCEPSNDTNVSRWKVVDFWEKVLGNAAAIHIAAKPGLEYNIFHLEHYIKDQAGGAIYTWIQLNGLDNLENLIKERKTKLNPKYEKLILEYRKCYHA